MTLWEGGRVSGVFVGVGVGDIAWNARTYTTLDEGLCGTTYYHLHTCYVPKFVPTMGSQKLMTRERAFPTRPPGAS